MAKTNTAISYLIDKALYLVKQSVSKQPETPVVTDPTPTHWLYVVDCSGSMYGQIDRVREHIKKKLPKMIGPKDRLSIVWFSSRGMYGTILEAEPVATLANLAEINKALDRWLRAMSMTGFKEALEEAGRLADKVTKDYPGMLNALLFMSDGCENQWPRGDVLKTMTAIAPKFSSCTVIEYGMYADRALLSSMAEVAGGNLIFAQDFDQWQPQFDAVLSKKVSGAPKIEVTIPGDPVGGFVYALVNGDLITYGIDEGKVKVPDDTSEVFYLSPSVIGLQEVNLTDLAQPNTKYVGEEFARTLAAGYAAVSLFAVRMQPNVVFPLLKALGDVQYIEQFSTCFGKQKYSDFMDVAKAASFDSKLRLLKGYDPNKVPREDSFTVLDLLKILEGDDANRILMEDKRFRYSRIGRGKMDSNLVLTKEEQEEVNRLTTEMIEANKKKNAKLVLELTTKIASISENKPAPLEFKAEPAPDGYSVDALVFNEDRPNVSLRVLRRGTVDISSRITPEVKGKVPEIFPTQTYRNYAIVKDGLVNVEILPVTVSAATLVKLDKVITDGLAPKELLQPDADGTLLINVKCLPVINRQMVKTASAEELFKIEWAMTKGDAAQKVFKDYRDRLVGKETSKGLKDTYGEELTKWLNELGFSDHGFNPKGVQSESQDVYTGKELKVALKGFSSMPKVADIKEKMVKKAKLTPSATLMAPFIQQAEDFLASDAYAKAKDQKKAADEFFTKAARDAVSNKRSLISGKSQLAFTTIVGQVWFKEFASLDENSLDLQFDGLDIKGTVEMKEIEIRI